MFLQKQCLVAENRGCITIPIICMESERGSMDPSCVNAIKVKAEDTTDNE